jgi:hypothetical protein
LFFEDKQFDEKLFPTELCYGVGGYGFLFSQYISYRNYLKMRLLNIDDRFRKRKAFILVGYDKASKLSIYKSNIQICFASNKNRDKPLTAGDFHNKSSSENIYQSIKVPD